MIDLGKGCGLPQPLPRSSYGLLKDLGIDISKLDEEQPNGEF